jgi:hypothetical protein
LRTRSVETRLAVRLATHPFGNCRRTLAMSTLGDRMETPAPRISSGSAPVRPSTMSISWIIRSRITSTSRLRWLNTLSRWISKNSGRVSASFKRDHRRVEALQVPHLEDAPVALSGRDEPVGGFQIRRDGLLHQHVDAGFDERQGHGFVRGGGHRDNGGVHLAGQRAGVGQRLGVILRGGFGGARGLRIHHRAELGATGFVDHAAVVLPELSGADYGQSMFRQLVSFHFQRGAGSSARSRLSAGWTRWKAGPRPEQAAPHRPRAPRWRDWPHRPVSTFLRGQASGCGRLPWRAPWCRSRASPEWCSNQPLERRIAGARGGAPL